MCGAFSSEEADELNDATYVVRANKNHETLGNTDTTGPRPQSSHRDGGICIHMSHLVQDTHKQAQPTKTPEHPTHTPCTEVPVSYFWSLLWLYTYLWGMVINIFPY